MSKKLNVEFTPCKESFDEVMSKVLITQLMITITQIGIREEAPEYSIIKKEKEQHDKEN